MDSLRRAADVTAQPQRWLWWRRIPCNAITLVDGDPGQGKSLLTLAIVAAVTRGKRLPGHRGTPAEGPVVLLNCEDDAGRQVKPRLQAQGANLENVFILDHLLPAGAKKRPLWLPDDADEITRAIASKGAIMLVIDPVMAFLSPNVRAYSDQSVRASLLPLQQIANAHGVAVILVRHLNKTPSGKAMYRGGGSIGFMGLARSSFL